MDYKETLNLPKTDFPMKGNLAQKEPELLKKWGEIGLYQKVLKRNNGRPKFILHDGPPYANGNIHFGTILNKILKDIICKYKNMAGFLSPYLPGWDCHGLPIEHQVDLDLGQKKEKMTKLQIREACRAYAERFVKIQKGEFTRLGVLGDWDNPYLTMNPSYEGTIVREFGRFVEAGSIYRGKKPVLWCAHCRTALAEAEIEYEEQESPSVYVKFPLSGNWDEALPKLKGKKVSVAIWTTTPWTLPANLAVALHPKYDYVVIPFHGEYMILAKNLLEPFKKLFDLGEVEVLERFSGKKLERHLCQHPFLPRSSLIILSDHVTIDTGTGCVHTAPGHGEEDFVVGKLYGLSPLNPVDNEGRFTEECGVPEWVGLNVFAANPKVVERLKKEGALLKEEVLRHSYPRCWRCKNPVIFRATWQWFLSLSKNDIREKAIDAIRRTQWIPSWGRERILGMVEKRPDWCLSRQRSWGVPIVALSCSGCEFLLIDPQIIAKVAERVDREGSDLWFREPLEKILPDLPVCPQCGKKSWKKEEDILDVWFESGVSFAAVLEKQDSLQFPADLYLEGSDQHRGWFHSSLIASIGTRSKPPYRTVLTHGFVVDGEGKKYSKSARNYVPPDKILKEYGAEILRLWVAAEDYRTDIRFSEEILKRLVDAYRKIRNTCRFLLGNLSDFDPTTDRISPKTYPKLEELDRYLLHLTQKTIQKVREAYEEFNFHIIFHELNRFCTVDLSSFYLDILKDRLYVSAPNDPKRRQAQGVLFEIGSALARLVAPILSFTSEEIWTHLPSFPGKEPSVHLTPLPEAEGVCLDEALASRWKRIRDVRGEVLKALERARAEKKIGSSLEAKVVLFAEEEPRGLLEPLFHFLPTLFIVSQVEWGENLTEEVWKSELFPTLYVEVKKAEGTKCARCWNVTSTVGRHPDHPAICSRCFGVLQQLS